MLGVVAICLLFLGALAIGGAMVQYPIRTVFWHFTHEKYINLGNARLSLPLLWWRDKDEEGGIIVLKHAKIDVRLTFMPSELNLIPLKSEAPIRDDEDAERVQSRWIKSINGNGPQNVIPIVITAPAGKIFCGRDRAIPELSSLYCFSSKAPWRMFFGSGSIQEESEAESILATLK
jgi:hypothetical protein